LRDPCQTGHHSLAGAFEGNQCRRLVEGAGGNLYIASAPGQGTTITVTLRRTSEVPPTSA